MVMHSITLRNKKQNKKNKKNKIVFSIDTSLGKYKIVKR